MAIGRLRVVSWNVRFAGTQLAAAQAQFLRSLKPDLVLLQEVNAVSIATYRAGMGLNWLTCSRSEPLGALERIRRPGAAIGGSGVDLVQELQELAGAAVPERVHRAIVRTDGRQIAIASYYAPPGVSFGYKKIENALALLGWLRGLAGPIIVGADANSPKIDHPDYSLTKSWWHTGSVKMRGRPGDDGLWGPNLQHNLEDALRLWLKMHPEELAAIVAERPDGPLAISHWTGKRTLRPEAGVARRYDSIWVTNDFDVRRIEYLVDSMGVLSDHAAVLTDLELVRGSA